MNATTLIINVVPTCVNNLNATIQAGEPLALSCLGKAMAQIIWFKYRTGAAGSYTINTDNNTINGQINIQT